MPHLAEAVHTALTADGRYAQYIHQVKVSTRRKTLGMSIAPGDPGLTVHVPADATPDEVVKLLAKNSHRLGGMLVKARQYVPDHPVKELVNGAGFLWLGRSKRLRIVDGAAEPVRAVDDQGAVTLIGRWLEIDRTVLRQGAKPITDWYIREGTAWLQQEVAQHWTRMTADQSVPTVHVDDIGRKRWGVYDGHTHHVRIAWQTFQLSVPLVRHVLVHELTHAVVPYGKPHGPEFWRAFERARTGARQEAGHLHEAGRHVWMGDIAA